MSRGNKVSTGICMRALMSESTFKNSRLLLEWLTNGLPKAHIYENFTELAV